MRKYTFNTREEVVEFLENHNFKYYIPRVEEYMSAIKDDLKSYYVEISNSGEVKNCGIISITGGTELKENFFEFNKINEFKNTAYNKQYREQKYKEGIENDYF
ncbi:hypothetical protein [Paraclostridium sordellii]|uniref:Uncharacterized protein n=1 Tax=Paraclostridium sordellii TaxID=1505 RepID=A0A0C7QIR0_PARSO|nr:hypothetical protein [Paeniclostridium sordellii]CEN78502.1 Uncharacterised protein [[Clostridium] sordellii] [Paeniclostridium sordellii]CEP95669.1 Uncharacterised protein [[Clostridium] sordellii] [Paeniclostridium sordellii]CEP98993.1 Uncharacterised protein [[Clostridium] sordellii] [Paeniclostridium sordellii]CEQ03598.1 Uncharacterised protein [[Clostridium] sordellii] [Paeniclostridium sordellii]